jgi:hypothetical protein
MFEQVKKSGICKTGSVLKGLGTIAKVVVFDATSLIKGRYVS